MGLRKKMVVSAAIISTGKLYIRTSVIAGLYREVFKAGSSHSALVKGKMQSPKLEVVYPGILIREWLIYIM